MSTLLKPLPAEPAGSPQRPSDKRSLGPFRVASNLAGDNFAGEIGDVWEEAVLLLFKLPSLSSARHKNSTMLGTPLCGANLPRFRTWPPDHPCHLQATSPRGNQSKLLPASARLGRSVLPWTAASAIVTVQGGGGMLFCEPQEKKPAAGFVVHHWNSATAHPRTAVRSSSGLCKTREDATSNSRHPEAAAGLSPTLGYLVTSPR